MNYIDEVTSAFYETALRVETCSKVCWVERSRSDFPLSSGEMEGEGNEEEFCENCIENAVSSKRMEWFDERRQLLGDLYLAESQGYFWRLSWDNRMKKQTVNQAGVQYLKNKLRTEYRLGTVFSHYFTYAENHDRSEVTTCQTCGRPFEYNIWVNEQEMEHWEGLSDQRYGQLSDFEKYELFQIYLNQPFGTDNTSLEARIEDLARRIYKLSIKPNERKSELTAPPHRY